MPRRPTRRGRAIVDHPILGITNGIHGPTWIGEPIADAARGSRRRPRRPRRERPRSGRFWERLERIPARDLWDAHLRQKRELAHFARGRLRSQFARHGEAPSVLAELETRPRSRRPDDRLRAPLRDLQAGRAPVQRHRSARRGCWPTRIARSRSSSPARPTRPTAPASASSRRSSSARARRSSAAGSSSSRTTTCASARFLVQGVDVWLNNPRRPLEASGHVRHEGGPERRPQRQRPRRLVGRGLRGATTAGRSATARPTPTRPPRTGATRRTCTGSSRRRSCPPTTSATRTGLPHALAQGHAPGDGDALWRFSTTRMLHEYTELLYLPAARAGRDAAGRRGGGDRGGEMRPTRPRPRRRHDGAGSHRTG